MITNENCTKIFYLHAANKAEKQHWIEALERSKVQDIEIEDSVEEQKDETKNDEFESSDNDLKMASIQACIACAL